MPPRFAAPAPLDEEDRVETVAEEARAEAELAAQDSTDHLHQLCEGLAAWARSRRLYGAPRGPASLLGQLQKRTRPLKEAPDALNNAQMAALWLAVVAQPAEAIDRRVFDLHYMYRVHNVKAAAAALGIGRQHWYTLLGNFRRRVYAASCEILRANEAAARNLPHRANAESTEGGP